MEEENKESKSVHGKISYKNGVVISVYVESVKTRLEYPIKTRVSGIEGYDRRAQLLAHSRYLRNQALQNVSLPTNQLQIKTIKKGPQLVQLCSCSMNLRRYRRVGSKVLVEKKKSQKKKSNRKSSPPILIKVRNMFRELSCKEI